MASDRNIAVGFLGLALAAGCTSGTLGVGRLPQMDAADSGAADSGAPDSSAPDSSAPEPRGNDPDWVRGGELPDRHLVLTYDDGPDENTLAIAEYLRDHGIRATFFVNGGRLCDHLDESGVCVGPAVTRPCDNGAELAPLDELHPESTLDDLLALGHQVASHSQDHCVLTEQDDTASVAFELLATQEILERHPGADTSLFRPPYGAWNEMDQEAIRQTPALKIRALVGWEIDGADWECWQLRMSVEECGERYLDTIHARPRGNGIILHHDRATYDEGSSSPLRLTKWLVPRLLEEGYTFVALDDVPGARGSREDHPR